MEDLSDIIRKLSRSNIVLLVALIASLSVGVYGMISETLQSKSLHYKCGDFDSYADVLTAYDNGAKYLDQNHDGVPCDNIFKATYHLK